MTDDLWKKGATLIVMAPIRPICSGVAFVESANTCQALVGSLASRNRIRHTHSCCSGFRAEQHGGPVFIGDMLEFLPRLPLYWQEPDGVGSGQLVETPPLGDGNSSSEDVER
jgi:hypothetical protein